MHKNSEKIRKCGKIEAEKSSEKLKYYGRRTP